MKRPILTMPQGTAAVFVLALCAIPAGGQIRKISVCQPNQDGPQMTCLDSAGTFKLVVAPDGQTSINQYAGSGITDEHSSVLPPGSVQLADGSWNTDYLFFVASGAAGVVQAQPGPDIGVLVLSASGPQTAPKVGPPTLMSSNSWDPNFQWTMDFASGDGYGTYCGNSGANCIQGTVFLPPILQGNCPQPSSPPFSSTNRPLPVDTTFDLSYAAAGSILPDPTGAPGSMLMLYEGANGCNPPGTTQATINMGVATSDDYGRTWPTYRGAPYCLGGAGPFCDAFEFYPLPYNNPAQGPRQAMGAVGPGVCRGNDCSGTPPVSYGRYEILPAVGGEPSAFVDYENPASSSPPYVYLVVKLQAGGIGVDRAQLGRHHETLQFETFDGRDTVGQPIWVRVGTSANPEIVSILPSAADLPPDRTPFSACLDNGQKAGQPQISYYPLTGEYVLFFVCSSDGDPAGSPSTQGPLYWSSGSAWFWSATTDLASQKWSAPQEIYGSWSNWYRGIQKNLMPADCKISDGWYPTFMSLGQAPGVLSEHGYVFTLYGDLGGCELYPRQYASHAFTISTN